MENVDSLNPFVGYSGVDFLVYHLNYQFLTGFEPTESTTSSRTTSRTSRPTSPS
jgi:hypothetical protein